MYLVHQGLKNLNSDLPFRQAALKFCLLLAGFSGPFFNLVGRQLAWALAHQASDNEKLLALRENLLVPDKWTILFASPVQNIDIHGYSIIFRAPSLT